MSKSEFIAHRVRQYTSDIKTLCRKRAEAGQRTLRGFFVPMRKDNNYETSYDGPFCLDVAKSQINSRPTKNIKFGGIYTPEVYEAGIYLFDGFDYDKPTNFYVDSAMIETVRSGVLRNLSGEGFSRLQIELLTGPRYGLKKGILGERISLIGRNYYLYVDISW